MGNSKSKRQLLPVVGADAAVTVAARTLLKQTMEIQFYMEFQLKFRAQKMNQKRKRKIRVSIKRRGRNKK